MKVRKIVVMSALSLVLLLSAISQTFAIEKSSKSELIPVSAAKNGFTLTQIEQILKKGSFEEGFKAGDFSLYGLLNMSVFYPVATIHRQGPVTALEKELNPAIGKISFKSNIGKMPLNEYIVHPKARTQGMIVIHKGKIVFEEYPGMREIDNHMWMSCTKTIAGLIIALLEEEGKIDVQKTVDFYLPEFKETAWKGIKVIDVLDMSTGLDVEESPATRDDTASMITRMNRADLSVPYENSKPEKIADVLKQAKKVKDPGQIFEYSSVNTRMLVLLSEKASNRRWSELVQEKIWSKMTVEGDAFIVLSPDGLAAGHGFFSSRLRDLGRYGLLYTPSWNNVTSKQIVTQSYLKKIQKNGRNSIYPKGAFGKRMLASFAGDKPVANSYQWDAVFADGDFYKSGLMGQGLYVSPSKDLVIAWFSTVPSTDLPAYARLIAKSYPKNAKK